MEGGVRLGRGQRLMEGWVPAVGPARVGARLDPGLTKAEGPVNYRSLRQTVRGEWQS